MGKGKIKLSDTIQFGEPEHVSSGAVQPHLEIEVRQNLVEVGNNVPIYGRFHWPGPGSCELVEFMIQVSGRRSLEGTGRAFVQVAESAHQVKAAAGEAVVIPVVWLVPDGALGGQWDIKARVGLVGGALFTAESSFAVSS
jgi:hypothetical protein